MADKPNNKTIMNITQLAYISSAAPGLGKADIEGMVEQSRAHNRKHGITGYLQCHDGYFFQVLEGQADAINALLRGLAVDQRHSDLRVLFRDDSTSRAFADWNMGFCACDSEASRTAVRRTLESLRGQPERRPMQVLALFFDLMDKAKPASAAA
jgi:hypothetical protein